MQPRDPCLPWRGIVGPGHTPRQFVEFSLLWRFLTLCGFVQVACQGFLVREACVGVLVGQGSPIIHSSCKLELGIALQSLQGKIDLRLCVTP